MQDFSLGTFSFANKTNRKKAFDWKESFAAKHLSDTW